jgi:hypothetical protein
MPFFDVKYTIKGKIMADSIEEAKQEMDNVIDLSVLAQKKILITSEKTQVSEPLTNKKI